MRDIVGLLLFAQSNSVVPDGVISASVNIQCIPTNPFALRSKKRKFNACMSGVEREWRGKPWKQDSGLWLALLKDLSGERDRNQKPQGCVG